MGWFLVVAGSLGVPQLAWAQSWSVAQSKFSEKGLSNAGLTVGVQMRLSHIILGRCTKHSTPLRGKASR